MSVRKTIPKLFLCVLMLVNISYAQLERSFPGQADEITSLPGIPSDVIFKQYSGYLRASPTKHLHYWLVESEVKPSRDPLVLWLNGGPGCSSMEGFLTENGPFKVDPTGEQLYLNPYAWNKLANVLYLESPAGVGFSYADDGNVTTNDDETAENNYAALQDFLRLFPQYVGREFYVSGESYGGIYVPTLMVKLMEDENFNLKGGAIGNGVFNREFMSDSKLKYFYYHGLMGTGVYTTMVETCCENQATQCVFFPFPNDQCQQAVGQAYVEAMKYQINQYNILAPCEGLVEKMSTAHTRRTGRLITIMLQSAMHTFSDRKVQLSIEELIQEEESNPPCTDESNVAHWLNRPDVQEALRVNKPMTGGKWTLCSPLIDATAYTQQYTDMEPVVRHILEDKKQRLLLYNGDLDSVCDFLSTQRFVDSLNLQEISVHEAWHYTDPHDGSRQVGGFQRRFQQLHFMTVRAAGHMVPTDQPAAAFHMFTSFLRPPQQ